VGQVALDQEVCVIEDKSQDNLLIQSAIGVARSGVVVAAPVIHQNVTIGVIVLARFESLSPEILSFLSSAMNTVGLALHSANQRDALQDKGGKKS